jgi:hypothetical protein
MQIHIDRGERRPRCCRDDFPIIEANDRDVLGHAHATLAKRIDDTTGDLVAAAEDCTRAGAHAQQPLHGLVPPGFAPGACQHPIRSPGNSFFLQRLPDARRWRTASKRGGPVT